MAKLRIKGFEIDFNDTVVSIEDAAVGQLLSGFMKVMEEAVMEGRIPSGWVIETVYSDAGDGGPLEIAIPKPQPVLEPALASRPEPRCGERFRIADHGPVYVIDHFTDEGRTAMLRRADDSAVSLARVPTDSLRYGDRGWNRVA